MCEYHVHHAKLYTVEDDGKNNAFSMCLLLDGNKTRKPNSHTRTMHELYLFPSLSVQIDGGSHFFFGGSHKCITFYFEQKIENSMVLAESREKSEIKLMFKSFFS